MNSTSQPWWRGTKGEWYVVMQFILFGLIAVAPIVPGMPHWGAPGSTITLVLGLGLLALGAGMALIALANLGRNLSALPHPKDDAQMVEQGAYKLVRHPIYSGIIQGAIGYALLTASWLTLALALILLVFFDIKSRREEKYLGRKFSNYASYQQRVKKLIPFVY
ncbi:MAG: isoprenylcysteine carboxylmethyltransferase family protein [Chloroflexi bacterium]|nr:isoprenylcysteine carboxylmethyltransferase family protein [Chloroflexota bacterium]MBP8057588.1 isoprenylcysteine carboxylmethyltransferase family protein [Chloroflexota bacterium]